MIISRTPFRISFFGGGTDYPQWYMQHGGAVIGTTINKYCYISVRALPPFFEHRHRIAYSRVETVKSIAEIDHPAVRAVLHEHEPKTGLEIHHDGDLPARTGLGTSSSFTVGLLNALNALDGRMSSARQLASEAIRIEQSVIRENVGSQDQVWAAFGGTNVVEFRPDGEITVTPLIMTPERRVELREHLMLVYTGISRIASEVAGHLIVNLDRRAAQLAVMRQMVDEATDILSSGERGMREFGGLMDEAWRMKRELADGVSNNRIDALYEAARSAGAYGGKLLGAGGGGFMLFVAPPEAQGKIRERLNGLIEVDVDIGSAGSRIVVYEPNGLHQS
ncbi:MAG: kinase [Alphaproteobacteria bacterium]